MEESSSSDAICGHHHTQSSLKLGVDRRANVRHIEFTEAPYTQYHSPRLKLKGEHAEWTSESVRVVSGPIANECESPERAGARIAYLSIYITWLNVTAHRRRPSVADVRSFQ